MGLRFVESPFVQNGRIVFANFVRFRAARNLRLLVVDILAEEGLLNMLNLEADVVVADGLSPLFEMDLRGPCLRSWLS